MSLTANSSERLSTNAICGLYFILLRLGLQQPVVMDAKLASKKRVHYIIIALDQHQLTSYMLEYIFFVKHFDI